MWCTGGGVLCELLGVLCGLLKMLIFYVLYRLYFLCTLYAYEFTIPMIVIMLTSINAGYYSFVVSRVNTMIAS